MRYFLFLSIIFATTMALARGQSMKWPVLKHYDQNHLAKIAMPIGGIGTGTVSLGGRGDLRDWEIMNRPAKGFLAGRGGNQAPFFAIFVQGKNASAVTRALMGPLETYEYEGQSGSQAANHGLPRFRQASFDAAYPLGQVHLSDADLPVDVRLKAFNPFIPGDADASGIPIAVLRYEITNKSDKTLTVSVCGSMENFIGNDGSRRKADWTSAFIPFGAKKNRNEFRRDNGFQGIFMTSEGVDSKAEQWGTIALTTPTDGQVTYRTSVSQRGWGNDILDLWDDFSADGLLTEKPFTGGDSPRASLAVQAAVLPRETKEITFFLTWHFPNRFAWAPERVGNYYTTRYKDAWDVVDKTLQKLPELEEKTVEWVKAFCQSDLPDVVKEAALFNLSTLRSQTCFRTEDGRFYGWEGCNDNAGCCNGSCTHVWNYEQGTAFMFGELAKSMREIEFGHATNKNGLMSFRVHLPLKNAQQSRAAAADGQMGTIMRMYRDWQLSGDDELLRKLWPHVKAALAFAWIKGGWDGDVDGVMEGCQHNTMDVEYYGPNPQMELWYLGALRAAEEMSKYLGDDGFAEKCHRLFVNGSKWTDEHLFNGEYYEHIVRPPKSADDIAPGLRVGMGAKDLSKPEFQLARGCLVDQLVGQYMAHICGLGYLVKPENVKTTLRSIMKYNYKPSLHDHFNNMRSFALGEEAALLMAAYPYERPESPFPYFAEVMTGFEYTAAVGMLYGGLTDDGLLCIKNIRDRYDGRKRSPFDEAECGHHYARAMASWAAVPALTGFHYSAVEHSMMFNDRPGKYFWSNGYAYGMVSKEWRGENMHVKLTTLRGPLRLKQISIDGCKPWLFKKLQTIQTGKFVEFELKKI